MNTGMIWQTESLNSDQTVRLGVLLGSLLNGGTTVELRSDVGGGKTTFTKGLAQGLGIDEPITSPTFTISREYAARDGLFMHHYDFYRLDQPGILATEISESINDERVITVVEWADSVADVLPVERLAIILEPVAANPDGRIIKIHYTAGMAQPIQQLENDWSSDAYPRP